MHMAAMMSGAAQPHRPTAVEAPVPLVATAQWIGTLTHAHQELADGRGEALEKRLNRRIGIARQILARFGAVAQRLKQQRMAVRIVQSIETDAQISDEALQIRPWRRRFELDRENHFLVIA